MMDTIKFKMWMKYNADDVEEDSCAWDLALRMWEIIEEKEERDLSYFEDRISVLEDELEDAERALSEAEEQRDELQWMREGLEK